MSVTWIYAIGSVIVVSLASLIGVVTILMSGSQLRRAVFVMVSLAAGAMLGDAIIHLLPEAFEKSQSKIRTSVFVLAGVFGFFIIEKFLRWRHQHTISDERIDPVGYLNLFADGLHNFLDGILIGTAYLTSLPIGVATTAAVLLHEIPQEIGDFGVLLNAGFSKSRALIFNFLSAAVAIAGALIALVAGASVESFAAVILAVGAGGFIYIAGSDLLPELHREVSPSKSALQLAAMATGVGLMLLIAVLE